MPKMFLTCDLCGKEYTSYQCGKYNHFCSIECRRSGAYLMSENITTEDRERRSKQIIRVNKTINNDKEHTERLPGEFKSNVSIGTYPRTFTSRR